MIDFQLFDWNEKDEHIEYTILYFGMIYQLYHLTNNHMIPTELIDRALALTDRTMEDMKEMIDEIDCETNNSYFKKLSIEKFCYYLLSPDFIENFTEIRAKSMEKLISENLGNKVKMARQPIFTS